MMPFYQAYIRLLVWLGSDYPSNPVVETPQGQLLPNLRNKNRNSNFNSLDYYKNKANWLLNRKQMQKFERDLQTLADREGLMYITKEGVYWVYGEYRGFNLIYCTDAFQDRMRIECTRLASTSAVTHNKAVTKNNDLPADKQPSPKDIVRLFTNLQNPLLKSITFEADGSYLSYEDSGRQYTIKEVQKIFHSLMDFTASYAECYAQALNLGGRAVPALQQIANTKNYKLQSIAVQLLEDIALITSQKLEQNAQNLLCFDCLTICTSHEVQLSSGAVLIYYGCRVCYQSDEFINFEKKVIAVLNSQVEKLQCQHEDGLRVNWFICRKPFDFDQVEIVQATDEDVERFAVQIGNDTDLRRKPKYKQMLCLIHPDCKLSDNTIRILQQMFDEIEFAVIQGRDSEQLIENVL